MEVILENTLTYILVFLFTGGIIFYYLRKTSHKSNESAVKLQKARDFGLHEPLSLHPVVDPETCIGSGACIAACPEKDVLGMINGQAHLINASRCVGHGACFHACPLHAITLCIGTEQRGVELPHVSPEYETNIPGLYIAGELGGMGLIKNAVEQGKQAMENISKNLNRLHSNRFDVIIVGAGPAGISASLTAQKNKLNFLTIEQDSLGGSVFNFPRAKVVMTSPMNLPLYGKVQFSETNKSQLLNLWYSVLEKNNIRISEQEKVKAIKKTDAGFVVDTSKDSYTTNTALLCIGRRGSPRRLGVKGEDKEKVAYRLLDPELISNSKILVAGGGDSAIEAALLLSEENEVTISYRGKLFSRLKPKNLEKINAAVSTGTIRCIFNSNIVEILNEKVIITVEGESVPRELENDLVYIFAGGELPTEFLKNSGVRIEKKFGEAVFRHSK